MSGPDLSSNQRRTLKAREALVAKFPTEEARREYYADLAQRAGERARGGVVLSADEAAALREAYALLSRVAERARLDKAAGDA